MRRQQHYKGACHLNVKVYTGVLIYQVLCVIEAGIFTMPRRKMQVLEQYLCT